MKTLRKNLPKFTKIYQNYLLTALFLIIAIISCSNQSTRPTPNDLLKGTWTNQYQSGGQTYTEKYIYDGATFDGGSYKMKVVLIKWEPLGTDGIIYGRYTENSYVANVVGKFYAVSFTNLTSTNVYISGAYKSNGKSATDTLAEAINEFTIGNGYFDIYSSCKKEEQ